MPNIEPGTRVRSTEDLFSLLEEGTYVGWDKYHLIKWDNFTSLFGCSLHTEDEFEVI